MVQLYHNASFGFVAIVQKALWSLEYANVEEKEKEKEKKKKKKKE